MSNYTYDEVTNVVARTIQALTKKSPDESSHLDLAYWDMARGAMHVWESLAGSAALPADRERLRKLLREMPGYHAADLASDGMLYDDCVPSPPTMEAPKCDLPLGDGIPEAFPRNRHQIEASAT